MRRLRCGIASAARGLPPAWLGLVVLVVSVTGCATSSAEPTPAFQPSAQAERTDMEDDGLPVQVSPPAGIHRQADDPREPFSRNYGPPPLMRHPGAPARMSRLEEDALIARAITAHEMRRP